MPAATPSSLLQTLCQHEVFWVISTLNAGSLWSRHGNTTEQYYITGGSARRKKCRQNHGRFSPEMTPLPWLLGGSYFAGPVNSNKTGTLRRQEILKPIWRKLKLVL